MAKKDKKEKKGGLLGRLFGGAKDGADGGDGAAATPPAAGGGDERTIAPGYAPEGDAGDMTMAPGYLHAAPEKSGEIGHVSFGTGRFQRPDVSAPAAAPPPADPFGGLDDGAAGRTIAPEYVGDDDDDLGAGELTMAPGYAGPELKAPGKPADPFADPFADLGGGGAGELTMAPGYAGAPAGGKPGKPGKPGKQAPSADPFADFGAGEMTMAPGYAGPGLSAPGKAPPADPFADFGGPGESDASDLTMAPGYAGAAGGKASPADPFADFGAGEMTMAPGYAGADLAAPARPPADPFADPFSDLGGGAGDLTMAPSYGAPPPTSGKPGRGGPRPGEPFVELDPGDLTMAPSYGAPPPTSGRAVDPFADLELPPQGDPGNRTMAPAYATPTGGAAADSFDIDVDLDGPPLSGTSASGTPVIPEDAFSFDAPVVGASAPPRAATPAAGGEPFDPFGPALLDDPFAPAPAATPAVTPAPPADDDEDFRGERTMVDLTTDVDMLATLESTDELPTPDTPPPPGPDLEGELELGAPLAPIAPVPPPASSPTLPPPRPAPRARPMFQGTRPEGGGARHLGAATDVVLDAARGLVFAPAVEGGWTGVPAGFQRLSDGGVVGRGRVEGRDVVVAAPSPATPASGDEVRLGALPAEAKVDRVTRAVLWPATSDLENLGWRPARVARVEGGLSFTLPEGTRFEDDGAIVVPAPRRDDATSDPASSADPTHGRVTSRLTYLGVVEDVHEDGWARLTLPPGAVVEAGRVVVPVVHGSATPPLLRPERLPGNDRVALPLPAGALASGDVVWVPPTAAAPDDAGEPWADRDAAVVESRSYAGIREDLLDDGWVRLELPVGARAERAGDDVRVVVPPEYARLGDAAALLELERLPCGSLAFDLPPGAECLGWRVLVPPTPETPAAARRERAPAESRRPEPAPTSTSYEPEVRADRDPEPPSRKMKALDLFRKDKKKPQNDTITFDGVLRSESPGSGGAVAPDVPAPAAEPTKPEVVATFEEPVVEPVAAAVEAAPAEAAASDSEVGTADAATAETGASSLDDAGLAPAPLEPEVLEPTILEPEPDLGSGEGEVADASGDDASGDDASSADASAGEPKKSGRRRRKKK